MARHLFLPQTTLDQWAEAGKVDIQGDKVVDLSDQAEIPIKEAVHFVRLESGEDAAGWLKKVKPVEAIKQAGAEHYMTSVIVGDAVYEVVPGWIAADPTPTAVNPVAHAVQPAAANAKPGNKKFGGDKNQEADMLAKLLLDKLS